MKMTLNVPDQIFGIDTSLLKNFWLPAILIVAFFITLREVVLPKIDEINSINNQAIGQEKNVKSIREKINYLLALDKNELNKNADNLSSALLKEKNSYFLVNIIKTIADKFGFQIKSFSIIPGQLKGSSNLTDAVSKIPVELVVGGPQDNYLDFILALERNLPILVIDKFDLKTTEGVSEIDMTVSSYYIKGNLVNNIANLSLSDLTLKKDESAVLSTISEFQKSEQTQNVGSEGQGVEKNYVKFNRENPFSF